MMSESCGAKLQNQKAVNPFEKVMIIIDKIQKHYDHIYSMAFNFTTYQNSICFALKIVSAGLGHWICITC